MNSNTTFSQAWDSVTWTSRIVLIVCLMAFAGVVGFQMGTATYAIHDWSCKQSEGRWMGTDPNGPDHRGNDRYTNKGMV